MKFTKTVRASKKVEPSTKRPIRANRRVIRSDEEIEDIEDIDVPVDEEIIDEEPVQEELLFEVGDVAEVIAEVTGEPVDYTVDDETAEVTFSYGEDEITVTPEGTEEVVEDSTRISKAAKKIAAAKKVAAPRKLRR